MTPLNANAPLAKGRRDKLTGARDYSNCAHAATRVERMPEGHVHSEAEHCADCGAFIRWLQRPSTIARRRLNTIRLTRLLAYRALSRWERGFLESVTRRGGKLTPKQGAIVDRLWAEYTKGRP
jgi:hypothetical protein